MLIQFFVQFIVKKINFIFSTTLSVITSFALELLFATDAILIFFAVLYSKLATSNTNLFDLLSRHFSLFSFFSGGL
jgi:hypothetical protein